MSDTQSIEIFIFVHDFYLLTHFIQTDQNKIEGQKLECLF